jgi:fatty acid desaturase
MIPSFTYRGVHNDHHKRAVYGTAEDGEYLPFAVERRWHIILYLLFSFLAPLLLAGRFVVLAPLSWLHPRLRRWVWERASSLTIDLNYRRPAPAAKDESNWRLQEFLAAAYGITAITLAVSGSIPVALLGMWYLLELIVFLLNSVRTLAAHRYRNPGTRVMAFSDQFLDSVNVTGHPLITPLWAPVGLRFHATHHLFPAIPYHALGEAHRRLATRLSNTSVYLSTTHNSLWSALRQLWQEARKTQTA